MTDQLPYYVYVIFLLTTLATYGFLHFGFKGAETKNSNTAMVVSVCIGSWLFTIGVLSLYNFFLDFETLPPKFLIAVLPPLITVIFVLSYTKSRNFIMRMPIATLTYLHIVRIPVEIVLWWLALQSWLPMILTFEGTNYDILSGISAPFVAIFMVGLRSKVKIGAIIWNILALTLLVNIVVHAVLSAPFPFQKYGFDQPNIAVFHFPFIWLPGFIVPAVLFSHLTSLLQLFTKKEENL
ncbi:hypothetical protein N6H18_16840 [Reichenbachiella agarivorans]|uniref:Uncharacterized protein n=1 Tax=Reichenbachiella agarivorans TaxID=2979464 RepID=A0ABY6CNC6_9BACT|nr:hypothetical protein [Reichenbachiella agarivorans]UXP32011.1 hypothetical protein N6H18_16840 [Reichenbachiella agarivorans]